MARICRQKAAQFYCTREIAFSVLVDKKEVDNSVDYVDNLWITKYEDKFLRVWGNFSTESGKVTAASRTAQPPHYCGKAADTLWITTHLSTEILWISAKLYTEKKGIL